MRWTLTSAARPCARNGADEKAVAVQTRRNLLCGSILPFGPPPSAALPSSYAHWNPNEDGSVSRRRQQQQKKRTRFIWFFLPSSALHHPVGQEPTVASNDRCLACFFPSFLVISSSELIVPPFDVLDQSTCELEIASLTNDVHLQYCRRLAAVLWVPALYRYAARTGGSIDVVQA